MLVCSCVVCVLRSQAHTHGFPCVLPVRRHAQGLPLGSGMGGAAAAAAWAVNGLFGAPVPKVH